MYDTLNFHMAGIEPGQVLPLLDPKTAREVARVIDGKVSYQGNMKGGLFAQCSVSAGLKVSGSIAKFAKGSNAVALTLGEFREAVQELESLFGCSLAAARVSRMDCGVTVSVPSECKTYLSSMAGLDGFTRGEMDSGLYYWQKAKAVAIYDKAAELREHGEQVPEPFTVGGALRVEVRHMKRLTERYGGGKGKAVTLARLQEGEFWNAQLEHIWRTVAAINIRERPKMDSVKTAKDFANLVYRCGVQSMGEDCAMSVLHKCWKAGGMSESAYKRGRRKVRIAMQSDGGKQGEEFRESVRGGLERLRV